MATSNEPPSDLTTGRLSVYLRCLTFLESQNQETVSSAELAERFHLNSAQIRKDLACFGDFGTRGVGYNVARLKEQLVRTLGIDRTRNVLIVGAGNLGMALADYRGFNENGFSIVALMDIDRAKIASRRSATPDARDAARAGQWAQSARAGLRRQSRTGRITDRGSGSSEPHGLDARVNEPIWHVRL